MIPENSPSRAPVVVTGGAGYVGSVVVRQLLEKGYRVRVLDSFLYGNGALSSIESNQSLEITEGDVRERADLEAAFRGSSAVIHLAGLVGDPACALDQDFTRSVNLDSTSTVAEVIRDLEIPRLVFASTCSVYGAAGDDWLDEDAETAPVSLYAETNLRSEEILSTLLRETPTTLTHLRFATIYGVSPRMRFDLVVNLLTARAHATGKIEIHGGDQWRPQVHVSDVARALVLAVSGASDTVCGTFNVGSNVQNHRVAELGTQIAKIFPRVEVSVLSIRDPRSYRVSFSRIQERWGFEPTFDVAGGVRQVEEFLNRKDADASAMKYHNDRALRDRLKEMAD